MSLDAEDPFGKAGIDIWPEKSLIDRSDRRPSPVVLAGAPPLRNYAHN